MEFTGKKSVITPEGVFIIGTYDENGIPNAMNAAWGIFFSCLPCSFDCL